MHITTYSEARANLKSFMDRARDDSMPVVITRRRGDHSVLISKKEWDSIQETLYLLSSPTNAARLREAIAEADAGRLVEHELIEPRDTAA